MLLEGHFLGDCQCYLPHVIPTAMSPCKILKPGSHKAMSIGEAGARVAEISQHPPLPKGSPELKWLIPVASEPWKRFAMVQ